MVASWQYCVPRLPAASANGMRNRNRRASTSHDRMDLAGMEPVSNSRPAGGHTDRLAFIDCLRAIAVILVFLTHSTEIFSGIATGGAWLTETAHRHDFGRIGVVLFFAISGFLIPSSLRGRTGEGSRRFLLSRFFRLFPAFWVSIPISVWAHFWIVHVPITNRDVLLNFTMIPRAFGAQMVNGAYWTLEVELLFYGLCLFLFLGEILRNSFVLATLCFFSGFLFYSSQRPIFGGLLNPALSGEAFYMLLNLSVMFWGAVCRRMWDGEKLSPITAVMFWTYTAFWIIYRPAHLIYRLVVAHSIDLGMLRTVSGYSGGMALFAGGLAFRRRLTGGLAWLGRVSYSFYLLHGSCIHLLFWACYQAPALKGLPLMLYELSAFALSMAFAAAGYYAVEKPSIALGRRIARWFDRGVDRRASRPVETPLLTPEGRSS
jgi:peptidoglycan/LPS O-acetylase OafA/YrhL